MEQETHFIRFERIKSVAERHWLGLNASPSQVVSAREIRAQYEVTAQEYQKGAEAIYEGLTAREAPAGALRRPVQLANRNVQLFVAYSLLFEAFKQIYLAASYTHFARQGPDRQPTESYQENIQRVMSAPYLPDSFYRGGELLKNGETVDGALTRMLSHRSREMCDWYGRDIAQTLTDMSAFLLGQVTVETTRDTDTGDETTGERNEWMVRAQGDDGAPLDVDVEFGPAKYRGVVKCHCWQIRNNLNFVGKSEGSIDDAILMMRAYCLVLPVVEALLKPEKRDLIFALS